MRICRGAALALVLSAGCIDQLEVDDAVLEETEHGIEIGTNDTSDPVRNAVVRIGASCTGTLISPTVVLTSARCENLWHPPIIPTDNWIPISPVSVYFGPDRDAPIATVTADAFSRRRENLEPGEISSRIDLAMLRLTAPVPATVAVPRPVYVDRPVSLTSTSPLFLVGYGGERDRRFTTATGYRDWLTTSIWPDRFRFTPTHPGAGTGGAPNNEEGDDGGPLLLGGVTGYMIGALIDVVSTGGVVTFGPGSLGRGPMRDWIQAKAPQKPDFEVISISATGCSGTGGHPMVKVTLKNRGVRTAAAWVDVFHGFALPPSMGMLSLIFRTSGNIAPEQTISLNFDIPAPPGPRWIDVLLDTTSTVAELDESNNAGAAYLNLPDCSFG